MWTLEKFIWPKIEHETTTKPITLHTVTNFKRDCHGGHLSASMQASVLPVLHCQATWYSWLIWCIVGQYTSDQAFCPHGMIPRVLAMSLHVLSYLLIVPSKILELVLRYGDYAGRCQVSAHNHPTALINWNSGWFRSGAVLTRTLSTRLSTDGVKDFEYSIRMIGDYFEHTVWSRSDRITCTLWLLCSKTVYSSAQETDVNNQKWI